MANLVVLQARPIPPQTKLVESFNEQNHCLSTTDVLYDQSAARNVELYIAPDIQDKEQR